MTENERGSARLGDEDVDVFDLAFDCIGRCITAVTSATPVVGEDGEVRRKVS